MPIRVYGDLEHNLDIAMQAADKAAKLLRSYHKENKDLAIQFKGKNDLVTKADLASEALIKEVISKAFPDDLFLAEESHTSWELSDARTWIIDPIDGTTNFAHGFPTYCISIALHENKQPVLGLILEASKSEMFTAVKGKGAFLNGRPIHVSNISEPKHALLATGFPYKDLGIVDDYLEVFKVFMHETQGVRRPGSAAYDLACVAAGRFDGFYEYGLSPWDVAAGILIIQEAGGVLTDWEGGNNYVFGQRIVAGNAAMHSYILNTIQKKISPSFIR
ncbi:inositol monophosphatase [bacterium]|nr:MAG: inositol monophosphatase [bacterium]